MADANGKDAPPDPITSLAEGAARLHELYTSYVNAGFKRSEALQIIIGLIGLIRPQPPAA